MVSNDDRLLLIQVMRDINRLIGTKMKMNLNWKFEISKINNAYCDNTEIKTKRDGEGGKEFCNVNHLSAKLILIAKYNL